MLPASRTRAGALALTLVTSLGVAGATPANAVDGGIGTSRGGDANGSPETVGGLPGDVSERLAEDRTIPQTSDGEPGWRVPQRFSNQRRTITNTVTEHYTIVPGLSFARFDRNDSVRGNVRGQLLTMDLATPGLSIDLANPRKVAKTATVETMLSKEQALAGVNGDFFDIGDTGASLGIELDRVDGLIKGPRTGWNSAFWFDAAGVPQVGSLEVRTSIKLHRNWKVAGLNPPSVPEGEIAAYDDQWGVIKGSQVTDGQTKRVRLVQIKGGRVVANLRSIPRRLKFTGKVLIGRGKGAERLSRLRVGTRSGVRSAIPGRPQVAITGDRPILIAGIRQVINDIEMHPRTAIGIDRDTNRLLILVVDGRQSFSRGMTMVELSQLMTELGADDALNLDGGGSSTMLAPDAAGAIGVRNSPSDGHLRQVANGLVIDYVPDPAAVATPPTPVFPTPAPVTPPPTPPTPPPV